MIYDCIRYLLVVIFQVYLLVQHYHFFSGLLTDDEDFEGSGFEIDKASYGRDVPTKMIRCKLDTANKVRNMASYY